MPATLTPEAAERLARKRAGAKLGWYIHASVYLAVNTLLLLASLYSGKAWAVFPLMGWGLGLTLHGAAVWLSCGGNGLHDKLLERERARLVPLRDPW
jgi:2TM domain